MPGGESLVRQALIGKAYMAEKFGVEPRVAYCVDSFGHAGTLPMIFKKCGFDYYVMMRPGPHEKELPSDVFWWQSPDGSRVLTFRIAGAYTTRQNDHEAHIRLAVERKPPQLNETMCFFGVGNHGGGPTKRQIENVQQIAAESEEWDVRFSDPQTYFSAIEEEAKQLPTVAEELQFHAIGCYSVVSELKRTHRQAENGLLVAERMAAMANLWAQQPVPTERLATLWHDLCFNQFHDTLGGTSLKRAEDDAIGVLRGIVNAAEEISVDAGRAIAAQIDTSGEGGTVVVFNPSADPLEDYVEYEPWTDWTPWIGDEWGLLDETGAPVTYQLQEKEAALSSPDAIPGRLLFPVKVPAMGYRVYRYAPGQAQTPTVGDAHAEQHELQNDLLHVRLDPVTGNIISCVDKATGIELVGHWRLERAPGAGGHQRHVDSPPVRLRRCGRLLRRPSVHHLREWTAPGVDFGRTPLRTERLAATDLCAPGRGRNHDPQLAELAGQVEAAETGLRCGNRQTHRHPRHSLRLDRAPSQWQRVPHPDVDGSSADRRPTGRRWARPCSTTASTAAM